MDVLNTFKYAYNIESVKFDLTTWTVTYVAHGTYGHSVLDGVRARLRILTAAKTNLKDFYLKLSGLPSKLISRHTTSAGEDFACWNAGATGLDFTRPLE